MQGEGVRNSQRESRPVDLSVFMNGSGIFGQDRDRYFSSAVPAATYRAEGAPLDAVPSATTAELRANPDRTSHPLATSVALRLLVENGGV